MQKLSSVSDSDPSKSSTRAWADHELGAELGRLLPKELKTVLLDEK